jgi:hypothetical protein
MKQLTERQTIKITSKQKDTLFKLKYKYGVDVSRFIRDAISEKIKRDWDILNKKLAD